MRHGKEGQQWSTFVLESPFPILCYCLGDRMQIFETDVIIKLFLGYGVVYTFVTRSIKVPNVPTLNNCREFS